MPRTTDDKTATREPIGRQVTDAGATDVLGTQVTGAPEVTVTAPLPLPSTPPVEPLLQFFEVPDSMSHDEQSVARPFGNLATLIVGVLPRNSERTVALRELLNARTAALRALSMR